MGYMIRNPCIYVYRFVFMGNQLWEVNRNRSQSLSSNIEKFQCHLIYENCIRFLILLMTS